MWSRLQVVLDEIFNASDADGSGDISKAELIGFLTRIVKAKNAKRSADQQFSIEVTDADADWIIAQCDSTKEGTINRDEALEACAQWVELLKTNSSKSAKSSVCTRSPVSDVHDCGTHRAPPSG